MRNIGYIITLSILSICSLGQNPSQFKITERLINANERTIIEELKKNRKTFYEDDKYIVRKTCSGEWGGSVRFKNKKSGIEYSGEATCPISLDKVGNKYYVTCSLAHLRGFSTILEISSPDSMEVFPLPPPIKKKRRIEYRYAGDSESKSRKGIKVLLDSIGVLALGSFVSESEVFYVVTDFNKTYVAKIENKKFKPISFITNMQTWSYENEEIRTDDGHVILIISGGYIDIFEMQITLLKNG